MRSYTPDQQIYYDSLCFMYNFLKYIQMELVWNCNILMHISYSRNLERVS